ncbi:hypothetical protein [Okeania sp. SIO2B3]|uniref:hypothetical protein n=1 Tax=Okeania sp. SIO2B3 TaxID=2607784 RepID=UPI0013C1C3ED|nr:hypothetical protein [Okeania sp. SIO2B3]NET45697.1 hypothetical protein [Okeania sp. SIO2B3]
MPEYYPVLKIPPEILKFAVKCPEKNAPQFPEVQSKKKPEPPVPPLITKPLTPNRYSLLGIIGLAIVASVSWFSDVGHVTWIILTLIAFIAGYIYYREQKSYDAKKAEYDSILLEYTMQVDIYSQKLERWKKSQSVVKSNVRDYQQKLASYHKYVAERTQKIKVAKALFQNIQALKPTKGSNAKKGRSEDIFLKALQYFFPRKIIVGYVVAKYSEYPYTPDFIYYLSEWNLYVDIEIDEPYTLIGRKKIPTHCTDDPKEISRDNFFIQNNWIVIRFTEEQILKYPVSCCKFISESVSLLTGTPVPEELQKVDDILAVPRWSSKKAKQLSRRKHRGTY